MTMQDIPKSFVRQNKLKKEMRILPFSGMLAAVIVAVATSSTAGTAIAVAEPPAPVPSKLEGCQTEFPDHTHVESICRGGVGEQRVTTQCNSNDRGHTQQISKAGEWVRAGQRSEVSCGGSEHVNARIEYRDAPPGPPPHHTDPDGGPQR